VSQTEGAPDSTETNEPLKLSYEPPRLLELGSLDELTQANASSGMNSDGGTGPNYFT
jgi:hypothetical protein